MVFTHDTIHDTSIHKYETDTKTVFEYLQHKLDDTIISIIDGFVRPKKYIFTEFLPGALQVQGKLSNTDFREEDVIFAIRPTGKIKKLECNYGIVFNDNYNPPEPPKKTSNRGRKPKDKKKGNRKTQGNGLFFNSQLTFWVSLDNTSPKIYKVKTFRNGTIKIPGILCPDLSDAYPVIEQVRTAMANCLMEDIQLVELHATMRNYKFKLIDGNVLVSLEKLKNKFIEAKDNNDELVKGIFQIKYNSERYPGLIVKFLTPTLINKKKETTIKMFQSGKVNIDGANQREQAWNYYNVLNAFYLKHADEVLYVPVAIDDLKDGSSSESD